jgi:hypothetical protein
MGCLSRKKPEKMKARGGPADRSRELADAT